MMQRQIDGVSKIRFVSFLRMVFARTDQRHPQIVLEFVFYGNPPAPGTFQGNCSAAFFTQLCMQPKRYLRPAAQAVG
jgi:hypothetical protein